LFGAAPLVMGAVKLARLLTGPSNEELSDETFQRREIAVEQRVRSQVLAVSAVTIGNGGDNLGVYIPLFANHPEQIPVYAIVFAIMTVAWCVLGHWLVRSRALGGIVQLYGHIALPLVLIVLSIYILSGARALLP
jgi:cadmium resistance protein CadD (predicted permease)